MPALTEEEYLKQQQWEKEQERKRAERTKQLEDERKFGPQAAIDRPQDVDPWEWSGMSREQQLDIDLQRRMQDPALIEKYSRMTPEQLQASAQQSLAEIEYHKEKKIQKYREERPWEAAHDKSLSSGERLLGAVDHYKRRLTDHRYDQQYGGAEDRMIVGTMKRLPISGAVWSAMSHRDKKATMDRIAGGKGTDADYMRLGRYIAEEEHKANRSGFTKALDIASYIPGYATEFFMTGGAYAAGRAATQKAALAGLGRMGATAATRGVPTAVKAAGFVGGTARQAAHPFMWGRAADEFLQRRDPGFKLKGKPGSRGFDVVANEHSESIGRHVYEAMWSHYLEIMTERSGATLMKGAGAPFRALTARLPKTHLQKVGASVMRRSREFSNATGMSFNPIEEYVEEVAGSVLKGSRYTAGEDPHLGRLWKNFITNPTNPQAQKELWEETGPMLAAFAMAGVGGAALSPMQDRTDELAQQIDYQQQLLDQMPEGTPEHAQQQEVVEGLREQKIERDSTQEQAREEYMERGPRYTGDPSDLEALGAYAEELTEWQEENPLNAALREIDYRSEGAAKGYIDAEISALEAASNEEEFRSAQASLERKMEILEKSNLSRKDVEELFPDPETRPKALRSARGRSRFMGTLEGMSSQLWQAVKSRGEELGIGVEAPARKQVMAHAKLSDTYVRGEEENRPKATKPDVQIHNMTLEEFRKENYQEETEWYLREKVLADGTKVGDSPERLLQYYEEKYPDSLGALGIRIGGAIETEKSGPLGNRAAVVWKRDEEDKAQLKGATIILPPDAGLVVTRHEIEHLLDVIHGYDPSAGEYRELRDGGIAIGAEKHGRFDHKFFNKADYLHRALVRDALLEGEQVSEEVLAQYKNDPAIQELLRLSPLLAVSPDLATSEAAAPVPEKKEGAAAIYQYLELHDISENPTDAELLGLEKGEELDVDIINEKHEAIHKEVDTLKLGPRAKESQELLNRLSRARLNLIDAAKEAKAKRGEAAAPVEVDQEMAEIDQGLAEIGTVGTEAEQVAELQKLIEQKRKRGEPTPKEPTAREEKAWVKKAREEDPEFDKALEQLEKETQAAKEAGEAEAAAAREEGKEARSAFDEAMDKVEKMMQAAMDELEDIAGGNEAELDRLAAEEKRKQKAAEEAGRTPQAYVNFLAAINQRDSAGWGGDFIGRLAVKAADFGSIDDTVMVQIAKVAHALEDQAGVNIDEFSIEQLRTWGERYANPPAVPSRGKVAGRGFDLNTKNAYAILGLHPSASEAQIAKAYRQASIAHHPDQNLEDPDAKSNFQRVAEAKDNLEEESGRIEQKRTYPSAVVLSEIAKEARKEAPPKAAPEKAPERGEPKPKEVVQEVTPKPAPAERVSRLPATAAPQAAEPKRGDKVPQTTLKLTKRQREYLVDITERFEETIQARDEDLPEGTRDEIDRIFYALNRGNLKVDLGSEAGKIILDRIHGVVEGDIVQLNTGGWGGSHQEISGRDRLYHNLRDKLEKALGEEWVEEHRKFQADVAYLNKAVEEAVSEAKKEPWEMTKAEFLEQEQELRRVAGGLQEDLDEIYTKEEEGEDVWGPLHKFMPEKWRDGFMFMSATPVVAFSRKPRIFTYKHGITRRAIHLDQQGKAYKSSAGEKTIHREEAIERVFEGLERLASRGVTRETAYDEKFRETKAAELEKAGFKLLTLKPGEVPVVSGEATTHLREVKKALAEGKDVPQEVLADYPDLAAPKAADPKKGDQKAKKPTIESLVVKEAKDYVPGKGRLAQPPRGKERTLYRITGGEKVVEFYRDDKAKTWYMLEDRKSALPKAIAPEGVKESEVTREMAEAEAKKWAMKPTEHKQPTKTESAWEEKAHTIEELKEMKMPQLQALMAERWPKATRGGKGITKAYLVDKLAPPRRDHITEHMTVYWLQEGKEHHGVVVKDGGNAKDSVIVQYYGSERIIPRSVITKVMHGAKSYLLSNDGAVTEILFSDAVELEEDSGKKAENWKERFDSFWRFYAPYAADLGQKILASRKYRQWFNVGGLMGKELHTELHILEGKTQAHVEAVYQQLAKLNRVIKASPWVTKIKRGKTAIESISNENTKLLNGILHLSLEEMDGYAKKHSIPSGVVEVSKEIRKRIDSLSSNLFELLERDPVERKKLEKRYGRDLFEIFATNEGVYLHRSYRAFNDPSYGERFLKEDKVWIDSSGNEVSLKEHFKELITEHDFYGRIRQGAKERVREAKRLDQYKEELSGIIKAFRKKQKSEGIKGDALRSSIKKRKKAYWSSLRKDFERIMRNETVTVDGETRPLYKRQDDNWAEDRLRRLIAPERASEMSLKRRRSLGRADMNSLYKRSLYDEYFHRVMREVLGEIDDYGINALSTVEKISSMIQQSQAQEAILEHFKQANWIDVDPETGEVGKGTYRNGVHFYKQIPKDQPEFGVLQGMYVTRDAYQALIDYYGSTGRADEVTVFERFQRNMMFKIYGKTWGFARASKTILSTTVQIRNYLANATLAFVNGHFSLDGTFGQNFMDSMSVAAGAHGRFKYSEGRLVDRNGTVVGVQHVPELVQELLAQGVIFDTPSQEIETLLAAAWDRPMSDVINDNLKPVDEAGVASFKKKAMQGLGLDKIWNASAAAYRAGDDVWKVLGWLREVQILEKAFPTVESIKEIGVYKKGTKKGEKASMAKFVGSTDSDRAEWIKKEASLRVRDMYPTFSNAPFWVKAARWFPLFGTFPTYFEELVRTQYVEFFRMTARDIQSGNSVLASRAIWRRARWIGTHAGGAVVLKSILGLLVRMFGCAPVGGEDEDLLREGALPPWSENSAIFAWRCGKGDPKVIDLSYLLPTERPWDAVRAAVSGEGFIDKGWSVLDELAGDVVSDDMVVSRLIEAKTGRTGSGGKLFDESDPTTRKLVRQGMHLYGIVEPGALKTITRTFLGVAKKPSVTGKPYNPGVEAASAVTGARVNNIKVSENFEYKISEFNRNLRGSRKEMEEYGVSDYQPSMLFPLDWDGSLTQFKRELPKAERVRKQVFSRAHNAVEFARRMGMSDRDIILTMKKHNLSRREVAALLNKTYPPYLPSKAMRTKILKQGYAGQKKWATIKEHFAKEVEIEKKRQKDGKPFWGSYPAKKG